MIIKRYGRDGRGFATMSGSAGVKRILHCHSTFMLGGKEARAVRLMNAFGGRVRHTILSAVPGALAARDAIDPGIDVEFPDYAPSLMGKPSISRYRKLADYVRGFDLVLTYNWGSMDAVGARRLFPRGCPPLIHHEDGFNASESLRLNWKRSAFRRIMLPTAQAVVVPSTKLESIARNAWKVKCLHRIPNGIDVAAYAKPPALDAIPGVVRREGEVIIGTLAGLRTVKNLPRLVRAVAPIANARLVIVGEGPERDTIIAEAARCNMTDRLIMPGFLPRPHEYIGLLDIFALSSDSEQFPISLIEAMAAGLPVVSTDVGDVRAMVAADNRPFVVPASDEAGLTSALARLAGDSSLCDSLGEANKTTASTEYDELSMIERYEQLYGLERAA
jgi:L-malate glycosyltransferase